MSAPASPLLTAELKETIQSAYRAWLDARGFKPRRGQREMIAEVARTLTAQDRRIAVIEAGTGTGKTAGYSLAAIPAARALNKTIVLSTATIALQEQVTLQDIPDLKANAGLQFSVALAKGRGRYVCLKRLDDHLKYTDQKDIPLFEELSEDHSPFFQKLLDAFGQGAWDGEMDSWPDEMPDGAWSQVTTDHRGCANNRCSYFKQCPFFKARNALEGVDVIVANHDLVLADLALGGGAVLPEPEACIYILDEAHHLSDKTQNHFSARARIQGTVQWLDHVTSVLGSLTQRFARPQELVGLATSVSVETAGLREALAQLGDALGELAFDIRDETLETFRFPLGDVPDDLKGRAAACIPAMEKIARDLEQTHALLQQAVAGELSWEKAYEAEDWLVPVGQLASRAQAALALMVDYAQGSAYRHARWVNRTGYDIEMVSAPIEPGYILAEVLWDRAYAAICTSATLTALGTFNRFLERSGLPPDVTQVRIPSPFDYRRIASFHVPEMASDPRDFDAHSEEVAALLPELIGVERSALVLFTSWRQLNAVVKALPEGVRDGLLIQGEAAKHLLIQTHRKRIDAGETSCLVGLASFSEGLDLPGDYCRHVVLIKLPFAVPDDPIDQAMAEWAEAQGKNAFYEISVPDAALKLIQACGRLIRHEEDRGRITMLDKRIVTQRYGRALLDSLPPFDFRLSA